MCIACWITKATDTHLEVYLQWLHECASVLRCTYTACLVNFVQDQPLFPKFKVKIVGEAPTPESLISATFRNHNHYFLILPLNS